MGKKHLALLQENVVKSAIENLFTAGRELTMLVAVRHMVVEVVEMSVSVV